MPKESLAQFYVVVRNVQSLELQRVPVTASLQSELATDFLNQMKDFVGNKTHVDFAPSYQPEKDELFQISSYAIPPFLEQAPSSPQQFQLLALPFTRSGPVVKAILMAISSNSGNRPVFLFQYFDRRRILNTDRTLIYRGNTFARLQDPGVVIADHLDAVIHGKVLLFHSFRTASQFLPLHDYFQVATDDDIRQFTSHRLFANANAEDVIATASEVTRKRISMVLKAGTLDSKEVRPEAIQAGVRKFGIQLHVEGKSGKRRIVFPAKRGDVRLLIQFLAEGLYIGPISGDPYVANSYRKLT